MSEEIQRLREQAKTAKSFAILAFVGLFVVMGLLAWNLVMLRQVGGLIIDLQERVERLERSRPPRNDRKSPGPSV